MTDNEFKALLATKNKAMSLKRAEEKMRFLLKDPNPVLQSRREALHNVYYERLWKFDPVKFYRLTLMELIKLRSRKKSSSKKLAR